MSAPAAKAFSEPVRTMAAILGEEERASKAVLSSVMRGVERALRALGRLRVTVQMLAVILYVGSPNGSCTLTDAWSGLGDLDELISQLR